MGHFISSDESSCRYTIGDRIRITEQFDDNFQMVGTIIRHDKDDDSYLVEFEYDSPMFGANSKSTTWYHGSADFVLANKPTYAQKATPSYCWHEWREDKWFTSKVFKTCKLCGARAEDV